MPSDVGREDSPVLNTVLDIVPVNLTKVPGPADLRFVDATKIRTVFLGQELGRLWVIGKNEGDNQSGGECGQGVDENDPSPCSPLGMR